MAADDSMYVSARQKALQDLDHGAPMHMRALAMAYGNESRS